MTVFGLGSLVAIIAAVSLTSERDGPGSQSLTASISAASTSASGCVATETMPGGDNFYVPNAPLVEDLGSDLIVEGTVREAGTCEPVRDARIQIWLNTARGGEGEPSNRGSVMTDENGFYRLETSPVVSQFGQPHVHIAYDDGDYRSLFLRSVMESEDVSSFTVDFVLEPVDE
ncbi:twin-arginine translocation pathway signal [filamentous cyanobacterium LEGE 07170]|nr:twin-arginine translocation pathway signal [filamentous cyanobacterium LEGE 07170]